MNRPPTIELKLDSQTINEGETAKLTVNVFDPDDAKALTPSINWDDGPTETGNASTSQYSHVYADNPPSGKFTINVKATDDDGLDATQPIEIIVKNVAPTIRNLNIEPQHAVVSTQGISTSTFITLNTFFTDPAFSAEEFKYEVKWGDNSSASTADITQPNNAFTITHTYTISNSYTITVTVMDDDGGTSEPMTEHVYVYD